MQASSWTPEPAQHPPTLWPRRGSGVGPVTHPPAFPACTIFNIPTAQARLPCLPPAAGPWGHRWPRPSPRGLLDSRPAAGLSPRRLFLLPGGSPRWPLSCCTIDSLPHPTPTWRSLQSPRACGLYPGVKPGRPRSHRAAWPGPAPRGQLPAQTGDPPSFLRAPLLGASAKFQLRLVTKVAWARVPGAFSLKLSLWEAQPRREHPSPAALFLNN